MVTNRCYCLPAITLMWNGSVMPRECLSGEALDMTGSQTVSLQKLTVTARGLMAWKLHDAFENRAFR